MHQSWIEGMLHRSHRLSQVPTPLAQHIESARRGQILGEKKARGRPLLMQLHGVKGVRVKIAKLEIFDDCEVAIRAEAGQW